MTTYTDAEVDAVALAIVNAARDFYGERRAKAITGGEVASPACVRAEARAALAARDALFEVVGERWEVRWPVRLDEPRGAHAVSRCTTSENAHAEANEMRDRAFVGVRVARVTTKRRKR